MGPDDGESARRLERPRADEPNSPAPPAGFSQPGSTRVANAVAGPADKTDAASARPHPAGAHAANPHARITGGTGSASSEKCSGFTSARNNKHSTVRARHTGTTTSCHSTGYRKSRARSSAGTHKSYGRRQGISLTTETTPDFLAAFLAATLCN